MWFKAFNFLTLKGEIMSDVILDNIDIFESVISYFDCEPYMPDVNNTIYLLIKNILKFRFEKSVELLYEYGVINKILGKFDIGFNRYIIKRIIKLKNTLVCDYEIWIKIIDTITGRLISENPYNPSYIKEILCKFTKAEYTIENKNHLIYLLNKSNISNLIQNINYPNPRKSVSILYFLNSLLSCLTKIKSTDIDNIAFLQEINESLIYFSNNIDLFLDSLLYKLSEIQNDKSIKILGVKNLITIEIIFKLIQLNYENVTEILLKRNFIKLIVNFIQYFDLNTLLHELVEKIFYYLTISDFKELRNLLWNEFFCEFLIRDMIGKPYSPFLARFLEGSLNVLGDGIKGICDDARWEQILDVHRKQTELQSGIYKQIEVKNTKEDVIKKKLMNFLNGSKFTTK